MKSERNARSPRRQPVVLEGSLSPAYLATRSATFQRAVDELRRLARDDTATVVLEGESGTGKTMLARWIHAVSPRRDAPYQPVFLNALNEDLAAAALFGHTVGAFTGANHARAGAFLSAAGGTVFLDEIGKISKGIQQKLLHVIETGEMQPLGADRVVRASVRIIAATNVPLDELVAQGEFLPDLFARLKAFRVRLPPLRERRADIPLLVEQSIQRHARSCGYERPPTVCPELLQAFQRADWPFNVRELDTAVHRLLVDAEGAEVLTSQHCSASLTSLRAAVGAKPRLTPEAIEAAIRQTGGVAQAARALGVDRGTIHRHRRSYDKPPHDGRAD
jgi:DNA-binding NtrC family response regulator